MLNRERERADEAEARLRAERERADQRQERMEERYERLLDELEEARRLANEERRQALEDRRQSAAAQQTMVNTLIEISAALTRLADQQQNGRRNGDD